MHSEDRLVNLLTQALGKDSVFSPEGERTALDGLLPKVVVRPEEPDRLKRLIQIAREEKASIIPIGSGSFLEYGAPPRDCQIVLETGKLNRIVEHDVPNLTVTVQAGANLGQLQETLARKRQALRIDPPLAPRRSVGGVIATGVSGPSRLLWGPVRDSTIGIRAVLGTGASIKAGTKVIKDVAGYNMNKLLVGSLGTLGIITEATFRLQFIAQDRGTVVAPFDDPAPAQEAIQEIMASPLNPRSLELLDPCAALLIAEVSAVDLPKGCWWIAAGFEGLNQEVDRQLRDSRLIFARNGAGGQGETRGDLDRSLWGAIRDLCSRWDSEKHRTVIRISTLISLVGQTCSAVADTARGLGLEAALWAHAGNGIIYVMARGERGEALARLVRSCQATASETPGWAVVESGPTWLRRDVSPWGAPLATLVLMRRIKEALDPDTILNPGRFVGGI